MKAGTLFKCDCCQVEVLAGANFAIASIEIRDRRHGTTHSLVMPLRVLVELLDPEGTSYVCANGGK